MDGIHGPSDLKRLNARDLQALASEIREKIIRTVACTGGHLGASLGVVELTIALHRVFDSPRDKIVWDVGHQCYPHKLVTGRSSRFASLRQFGGLSGFPKRQESPHDAFGTGHASTSISAAMGLAAARDLSKDNYHVVAVIGDGATTGGMSFEALNHAGREKTRIIIVLNDNGMSISSNVGALAQYLARIRTGPAYRRAKGDIEKFLRRIPLAGQSVADVCRRIKDSLKYLVVPGVLFEELGFTYLGPVDGHNTSELEAILRHARDSSGPTVVHVVTRKGKGYQLAEQDPGVFHGPGPFDPETGHPVKPGGRPSYSSAFGSALRDIARRDPRVVAITAAMADGTGLAGFAREFPDRFFDVGIAEQHAVTLAAGMAAGGLSPVVAVYSTFLQRAYDQVNHDVCLQKLPVVFALDRAGIVGEDGETHQGVFDITYLLPVPNLALMAPSSAGELSAMLDLAIASRGPCAIRYPRGEVAPPRDSAPVEWGKAEVVRRGQDLCIAAVGHCLDACLEAADRLKERAVKATVLNLRFLKPLDWETVRTHAFKTRALLVVEEGAGIGGAGSLIVSRLAQEQGARAVVFDSVAVPDAYVEHGAAEALRERLGLDAPGIAERALSLCQRRPPA